MVSEMAMEDVEALEAKGVKLSPRDIVRLNALGLKIELNKHSAEMYTLPRVAFLDDVVFHEPTIGAELWLKSLDGLFDFTNETTCLFLRAFSMVTPLEKLPPVDDVKNVKETIERFIKDTLSRFTQRQIHNAVWYALNGSDATVGENAAPKEADGVDQGDDTLKDGECYEIGLLRDGVVLRLGSFEELKKLTVVELQTIVMYALELKGGSERMRKSRHSRLMADYYRTREEISNRVVESSGKDVDQPADKIVCANQNRTETDDQSDDE